MACKNKPYARNRRSLERAIRQLDSAQQRDYGLISIGRISFHPSLFAVSINNIYILSVIDDFLYRIPRDAHDGFERIKMGDNVGVLLMDNKAYLAFDELDIYLPIEPETLEKYGITQVANWEVTPI